MPPCPYSLPYPCKGRGKRKGQGWRSLFISRLSTLPSLASGPSLSLQRDRKRHRAGKRGIMRLSIPTVDSLKTYKSDIRPFALPFVSCILVASGQRDTTVPVSIYRVSIISRNNCYCKNYEYSAIGEPHDLFSFIL